MEGLKKLEEIQSMMMFMQSNSDSFNLPHSDSQRFIAQFLLFMMEPCGSLSVDAKCSVISQHLPKITPLLVEKALVGLPEDKVNVVRDSLVDDQVKESTGAGGGGGGGCVFEGGYELENVALIGLDAMQRANSTLEDFCRSYFMFHGMDVTRPEFIFKYLPVLSFTESYIYQLDSLNERMASASRSETPSPDRKIDEEACFTWSCRSAKAFETEPFQSLTRLLEHHRLLTDRIRKELKDGEEYWALERKLCCASEQISIEDVMRAIHLKSFDYRVLNLLLYQLRGEPVNDLHMEFLTVSEFLVEISDDLYDYEEDVLANNFNILRMFVRIYGTSVAPTMLAKHIIEAEEKYEKLSKSLDPMLYKRYQRRCEEATKEGGKISGNPLGSWTIPPLIVDEELYRSTKQDSP